MGDAQPGSESSDTNISELTKAVIYLQKAVKELSGNVNTLHSRQQQQVQDNCGTEAPHRDMAASQAQLPSPLGRDMARDTDLMQMLHNYSQQSSVSASMDSFT